MSVLAQVEDWPVETVAVGVTSATETLATHGPTAKPCPLASVTKPLAALAVLVAARDGALHLDEPAGPERSTVRHLLAHASGLPPSEGGPVTEPGTRRIYSNWGYDLLGELVADRLGMAFADHLDLEVARPLDMDATRLEGSPAHAATSTVDDLLALGRELLAADRLLDDDMDKAVSTVAFPGLSGVLPGFGRQEHNDWSLGLEIRDRKHPHWTGERNSPATFGHFGQSGSFLWVDPEAGLACACLAARDFDRWAAEAWPGFNDSVLDAFAPR